MVEAKDLEKDRVSVARHQRDEDWHIQGSGQVSQPQRMSLKGYVKRTADQERKAEAYRAHVERDDNEPPEIKSQRCER